MRRLFIILLIVSVVFLCFAFFSGESPSLRGFYYLVWLSLVGYIWRHRESVSSYLRRYTKRQAVWFVGLGLMMILIEETIAGTTIHLLRVHSFSELWAAILPYYQNFLLLPGFIVGWYLLLRYIKYSRTEVLILVGIFGLYAEHSWLALLQFPLMGLALILPNMATYAGIILPSLLSVSQEAPRSFPCWIRYPLGLIVPFIASIPLVALHAYLAAQGVIDPSILRQ